MKTGLRLSLGLALLVVSLPVCQQGARACSLIIGPQTAIEISYEAAAILRVRAMDYAILPEGEFRYGAVQFEVLEVIKGTYPQPFLRLPGQLEHYDGPNEGPVPYDFVRPGGRHGDCYAHDYKIGGEFLLLLRQARQWLLDGELGSARSHQRGSYSRLGQLGTGGCKGSEATRSECKGNAPAA